MNEYVVVNEKPAESFFALNHFMRLYQECVCFCDDIHRQLNFMVLPVISWLLFVKQNSQPKLEVFQDLLNKHPNVFYPSRTAKSLLVHWQLLKQYYLLDDQSGEHAINSWA